MNNRQLPYQWFSALIVALILALLAVGVALAAGYIDPTNKWAWSSTTGWINFAPARGGVTVFHDHLEGDAWGENIGWVRLGTYTGGGAHTYANDSANTYGVNHDGAGNLSGYAWGTNVGWINFSPAHGGVTVDPNTGDLAGYAWGENVGWIRFQNDNPAYKVSAQTFALGGTVNGLAGSGLVLQNNGVDNLPIPANGSFVFSAKHLIGAPYAVTVSSQPTNPAQTCTVVNGNGTLASVDVTDVAVTCSANTFSVGGTVSGLLGSGLVLQNNGNDDLPIADGANGPFTFPTELANGSVYLVTVKTQPSGPDQTCTVSNGSGTLAGADVTNVDVSCAGIIYLPSVYK